MIFMKKTKISSSPKSKSKAQGTVGTASSITALYASYLQVIYIICYYDQQSEMDLELLIR